MSNYSHSHDYETSPNPPRTVQTVIYNVECPATIQPKEVDLEQRMRGLLPYGDHRNKMHSQRDRHFLVFETIFPLSLSSWRRGNRKTISWCFGIFKPLFVQLFQLYLEQSSIQRRFHTMNHGCIACCLVGNHSHIICSVARIILWCSSLFILLVTGGVNAAEQYNDELKQSQPLVKSRKRRKTFWQRGCQTVSLDAVSKTLCDALSSRETLYVVAAAQDKWLKFIVTLIHERIYYTGTGTRYRQHVQTFK